MIVLAPARALCVWFFLPLPGTILMPNRRHVSSQSDRVQFSPARVLKAIDPNNAAVRPSMTSLSAVLHLVATRHPPVASTYPGIVFLRSKRSAPPRGRWNESFGRMR